MTFEVGALLLIDYTAKIKGGGVLETTRQFDAVSLNVHKPDTKYEPKLVSVGKPSYPVLKGLDHALRSASVDVKFDVEVDPENAFGSRNPKMIRQIPQRKLGDQADKVNVGDHVTIDDKKGIIRFIGSGRIKIDFNHKHAGKTILYNVNVVKTLISPNDVVTEILKNKLQKSRQDAIPFEINNDELDIMIPKNIFRIEALQQIKNSIQIDVFQFAPALKKLTFLEAYHNKSQPASLDL